MIGRSRKGNRRVQPSTWPARWRWFAGAFFAVGVVIAMAAAVSWLLDPRNLPIREVRVVGDFTHLSPNSLQRVVASKATGGFFSVDVESIRQAVMRDPWVRDVSVRRIWPDSLQVLVTEQRAAAYWGSDGLLNTAGELFHPPKASFPPASSGLLHLNGPVGSEGLVMERYRQLKTWFKPLGLTVDKVSLNSRRAWTFELQGGISVIVGRGNFDMRVQRLLTTLPRSIGPHLNEIATIDLRYTNGFAVMPRANADKTAG
jgi:cell division protein FtsQ